MALTNDPDHTLVMNTVPSTSPGSSSAVAGDEIAAFSDVTEGLLSIGAVTAIQYLSLPTPAPPLQQFHTVAPPPADVPVPTKGPIGRLHQACQHTFGNASALKFSYEEVPEQGALCGPLYERLMRISPVFRKAVYSHHHTAQRRHAYIRLSDLSFQEVRCEDKRSCPRCAGGSS